MKSLPSSIQKLIQEFNRLPGIGSKTSERFVFHLLQRPKSEIEALVDKLQQVRDAITICEQCYTYSENKKCTICANEHRDNTILCIVAEPKEVMAFEKTGEFNGLYHVLGGTINHAVGVGPDQIRVKELIARIDADGVQEIILATNPDMEGETTAHYILQELKDRDLTITRIARGLPMGADIEFADEVTLANALAARQKMENGE